MVASRQEVEDRFLAALRLATGATEAPAQRVGVWSHATTFAGRPLLIAFTGPNGIDAYLGASLGERPIALHFATHHQKVSGLPPVSTGDASFDALYQTHGVPEEAVASLLDPGVRRWLVETFGGDEPRVDTSGGYVRLSIPLRGRSGLNQPSEACVPEPRMIAQWVQALLMVTDGLCRGFDAHHARILATQGPAAAQAWVERARAIKARGVWVSEPRALLWMLAVVCALVIVVGVIVVAVWFGVSYAGR